MSQLNSASQQVNSAYRLYRTIGVIILTLHIFGAYTNLPIYLPTIHTLYATIVGVWYVIYRNDRSPGLYNFLVASLIIPVSWFMLLIGVNDELKHTAGTLYYSWMVVVDIFGLTYIVETLKLTPTIGDTSNV